MNLNQASGRKIKGLAAALALGILGAAQLHAQTYTFSGNGLTGTNDWSDDTNWLLFNAPPGDGTGNVILSDGATGSDVDTNFSVSNLTQAAGSSGDLTAEPGATLDLTGKSTSTSATIANLSTSDLNILAPITNSSNSGLYFSAGTVRIESNVGSLVNISVGTEIKDPTTGLTIGGVPTTVYVNGKLSSAFGIIGAVTGSTIAGTGTISTFAYGNVGFQVRTPDFNPNKIGPTFSPGDPTINKGIGTLTIATPQLALTNTGGVSFDLMFGAGTAHSLLAISSGGVTDNTNFPAGNGQFNLTSNNNFNIESDGDITNTGEYALITYNGAAVDPSILATQALTLPAGWEGTLYSTAGVVGIDLTETNAPVGAVPEPQTWAMMGAGFLALFYFGRRKAARS